MSVLFLNSSTFTGMLQHCQHPRACVFKGSGFKLAVTYLIRYQTCQCLSKHAIYIEIEWPYVLICLAQFSLKHALTNWFVSVVGYISHKKDSPTYMGLHKHVHFRKHIQNRRWTQQDFRNEYETHFWYHWIAIFETSWFISKAGMLT